MARTLPPALKAHQFKKGHGKGNGRMRGKKARIGEQHGPVDDMTDGPPDDSEEMTPAQQAPEPVAPVAIIARPPRPRVPSHHAQHGQMRVLGGKLG